MEFSLGAILKPLSAIIGKLGLLLRRWWTERRAGHEPDSVPVDQAELLLDNALRRLGAFEQNTSRWTIFWFKTFSRFSLPKSLRTEHFRDWISRQDVQSDLKSLARATVSGAPEDRDARIRLTDIYTVISREDQCDAEDIMARALARLKHNLQGTVGDASLAALVQAGFGSIHGRLDSKQAALLVPQAQAGEESTPLPAPLDVETIERAFGVVSQVLLGWPQETDGKWIERPELEQLHHLITAKESVVTVLLGKPGEGKSAILARLGTRLTGENTILLAIKADQIPRKVETLDDLDNWIGSPIPIAEALRRLAAVRRVVVLIDQLDALAELMDQHSERLSALFRLVGAISNTPNLHVIMSCREFEFRNDVRLITLKAESIALSPLTWDQVSPLLTTHQPDADTWNEEVREVLRTPQHLAIFLSHLSGSKNVPTFSSYQGLLNRVVEERLEQGYGSRTVEAAERIAGEMAQEEELWLARDRFEPEFRNELKNLKAAEFLVSSENDLSIAFRHQTLFDFLRARSFLRQRMSLAKHVTVEKQESLFIRPILWSTLHYLRGADRAIYRKEFRHLWEHEGLRLHLRYLLISFLGQGKEPDDEEANWLLPTLDDPVLRPKTLQAVAGNAGWFSRLRGRLPALMTTPVSQLRESAGLLNRAVQFEPDAVFRLVKSHWTAEERFHELALFVLRESPSWDASRVEIVAQIADHAPIDSFSILEIAKRIARFMPDLAPEVFVRYLRARTNRIAASSDSSVHAYDQLLDGEQGWYEIDKLALEAPRAFVERLWPWIADILGRLAEEQHPFLNEYRGHSGLSFSRYPDSGKRHPFTHAIELAIQEFAETDPDAFCDFVDSEKTTDLKALHHLLALGLEKIVSSHSSKVLEYLLEDPRRFAIGDMYDTHRDSGNLISALVPVLGDDDALRLETAIISWPKYRDDVIPPGEDRRLRFERRKWNREHRLRLLRRFPDDRLSLKSQKHLAEEQRALPNTPDREVSPPEVKLVDSPMSPEQMTKATNDQIIKLFEELTDDTEWNHPRRQFNLEGGSIQASRAFADFAKNDSGRALQIIKQFRPGTQERPSGYALAALGGETVPPEKLIACIQELEERGFASEEYKSSAARCLREIAQRSDGLDDVTCDLLESWLSNWDPKAGDADTSHVDIPRTVDNQYDSILWGLEGSEVLPEGNYPVLSALTLGYLLRKPESADDWLAVLERHLLRLEDPRVWCALVIYLDHVLRADPDRSIAFFESLFNEYPTILESAAGVRLIGRIFDRIPSEMFNRILARWISGKWTLGPLAAGEIATLKLCRNTNETEASKQVERFLAGADYDPSVAAALRIGITHTLVIAWREPPLRELATPLLVRLASVENADIGRALSAVFVKTNPLPPDDFTRKLLEAFLKQPSILKVGSGHFVIERLKVLLREGWSPTLVQTVANTLVGDAMKDTRAARPGDWAGLVEIALTLHRLPETRMAGLDLFERLIGLDVYEVPERLKALDRRFP